MTPRAGRPAAYRNKVRITISLEADTVEALDRAKLILGKGDRNATIAHILEARLPHIDADFIEQRLRDNLAEREQLYAFKERAKHVGIQVPDELAAKLAARRQMIQTSFRADDPQLAKLNESWLAAQGIPKKDRERFLSLLQP